MNIPAPLISGSIAYLVLGAVLIGLSLVSLVTGMQTKDNVAWVFNMVSHHVFLWIIDITLEKWKCCCTILITLSLTHIALLFPLLLRSIANVVITIATFSMWLFWWVPRMVLLESSKVGLCMATSGIGFEKMEYTWPTATVHAPQAAM